ncbi:hypothetical protein Phum_PHUM202230 [Pediculus humanus corporis]|uniref:Uncharacterized protein n=1 Tax=Pediculus humanus subsp. corporis TaxID=121224 RepID=E0VH64_PEDHC|nr:uncharacterized protein Phum_PHUM202230 [Pediculus humanus corporis]EEB12720.1 hypothetical protein Phum_PHUM202230 [Pediculus humanus corporis]
MHVWLYHSFIPIKEKLKRTEFLYKLGYATGNTQNPTNCITQKSKANRKNRKNSKILKNCGYATGNTR